MVSLVDLWLPILIAAVIVHIASAFMHMALPFWHTADYGKTGNDGPFVEAMRSLRSGLYMIPAMPPSKPTEEQMAEWSKGPSAIMYLRNPASFSFPRTLGLHFLQCLVSAILVAYIAGQTLAPGTEYMRVMQIAGATGTIFWSFGSNISDAIWYGKPWRSAIKYAIDGLIYGLLMGGVFGWLWPE
ncbi:MAG TPA: hypothetical protein VNI54_07085 [Thermoanaerobaculia bacterium]|nr:hypothetical protein [Thermoanaerobaculia bacterium]